MDLVCWFLLIISSRPTDHFEGFKGAGSVENKELSIRIGAEIGGKKKTEFSEWRKILRQQWRKIGISFLLNFLVFRWGVVWVLIEGESSSLI